MNSCDEFWLALQILYWVIFIGAAGFALFSAGRWHEQRRQRSTPEEN